MRSLFISLAALAFIGGIIGAAFQLSGPKRLNVIVLTVESARLDAIGPQTTPAIWRLADSATRFTNHRSDSAWTGANIVSILTGLPTFRHGVHSRDTAIPAEWQTPLEDLHAKGWRIGGLQAFMLISGFRNLGLDIAPQWELQNWLAQRAVDREPFVLWHHYLETHLPYEATSPEPAAAGRDTGLMTLVQTKPSIPHDAAEFRPEDKAWIRPLYDNQFRVFDKWFAELWQFLGASGLRKNTILVLTTDHGEELLERGLVGHASTTRRGHLHEEIVRVPLIVWLPPGLTADTVPTVIDAPSRHTDIMPTVMRLLQVTPSVELEGKDLFGLPPRRAWQGLTSQAGFSEPEPANIRRFTAARVDGDWKLHIEFEPPARPLKLALYNIAEDPGETSNLARTNPARTESMMRALLPTLVSMRVARPDTASGAEPSIADGPPQWLYPAASGIVRFDELPNSVELRWRGPPGAAYRLQYEAGEGPFRLSGEMSVLGPVHNFGEIERDYWDRYIVPYGSFRFRVGYAGISPNWSPWLTIQVRK